MSLRELVRPDKTKPARLLWDPKTGQLILEYTGVDNNPYRVPVALTMLPTEFAELAAQLGYVNLLEMPYVIVTDFPTSRVVTVFVDNSLDQDVVVQIKANRAQSLARAVNVGSPFTVPAGASDARTLTPETSGFLPYITVSLRCPAAPTTGSVTVFRVRLGGREDKVVDGLEIRDTAEHDASTDPGKIFIVEW